MPADQLEIRLRAIVATVRQSRYTEAAEKASALRAEHLAPRIEGLIQSTSVRNRLVGVDYRLAGLIADCAEADQGSSLVWAEAALAAWLDCGYVED